MKQILAAVLICGLLSTAAQGIASASSITVSAPSATNNQFVGPEAPGRVSTVQEVNGARIGSYVTVVGNIVEHLREDYYTFRDETGEIRVEIGDRVWQNRAVTSETQVRLLAEVDRTLAGVSYLWVKSLEIVGPAPATQDAGAGFVGPEAAGQVSTVQEVNGARIGSYVTVAGNIVNHLREDYYTFRDETGEIRVEISDRVWQNRTVTPETRVRLSGEVDRTVAGVRYLWVKSLEIVE